MNTNKYPAAIFRDFVVQACENSIMNFTLSKLSSCQIALIFCKDLEKRKIFSN